MKYSDIVIHLGILACASVSHAFAPFLPQHKSNSRSRQVVFSSQWEDEDEVVTERTSFDDAGDKLKEEEDQKSVDNMSDYDANPQVCMLWSKYWQHHLIALTFRSSTKRRISIEYEQRLRKEQKLSVSKSLRLQQI